MSAVIAKEAWSWFGFAGHFILSNLCRFHLATKVGDVLVSTVGAMRSGSSAADGELGYGRTYETMVFRAGPPCTRPDCGCGIPVAESWRELDADGYKTAADATRGHNEMCAKWAVDQPAKLEALSGADASETAS